MTPILRRTLRPVAMVGLNLGLDPRRLGNARHLMGFWSSYRAFRAKGGKISSLLPVLSESDEQAGGAEGQYFHQDLLVARRIFEAGPRRHLDVGSRIDGFVAHVAAFRDIDVLDIRPLRDAGHPGIRFVQADLMNPDTAAIGTADSVSCLHAIEHFGLGRYGDEIDPEGHIRGFRNILSLVAPGGRFYISFPIGSEAKVEFNAHRIFLPTDVFGWVPAGIALRLVAFDYVDDAGALVRDADPRALPPLRNGCGIYSFERDA